jgi:hypothetical protein
MKKSKTRVRVIRIKTDQPVDADAIQRLNHVFEEWPDWKKREPHGLLRSADVMILWGQQIREFVAMQHPHIYKSSNN